MKQISLRQAESALFNLDSMRTKLLDELDEQPEREDELQKRIDEIENLLEKNALRSGYSRRMEQNTGDCKRAENTTLRYLP